MRAPEECVTFSVANARSECTHFECTKRYPFVRLLGGTKRYTSVHQLSVQSDIQKTYKMQH